MAIACNLSVEDIPLAMATLATNIDSCSQMAANILELGIQAGHTVAMARTEEEANKLATVG